MSFLNENKRFTAANIAVLYFTNNSLNVALESNVATALLRDSCLSMKKLSNSFSLLLSFCDFSENAFFKNSSSEDAVSQPAIFERFALLRRYFYFNKKRA